MTGPYIRYEGVFNLQNLKIKVFWAAISGDPYKDNEIIRSTNNTDKRL